MSGKHSYVPVTASDYRRLARKRLPRFLFDYIDGGASREETMAANQRDFGRWRLRQRVMCDVSSVDTGANIGGRQMSMPLALAPIGMAGMMARRGEVLGARAAEAAGIPFTVSTSVPNACNGPIPFHGVHGRYLPARGSQRRGEPAVLVPAVHAARS